MGKDSKIEWTDSTWNPVMGCTPVSQGCTKCFARAMIKRFAGCKGWPIAPRKVTLFPERLEQPLRWGGHKKIFVCDMGDLFHKDVPQYFISRIFKTMAACPQHTFQVLTKRPGLARAFFVNNTNIHGQLNAYDEWIDQPLPNVWLGVSVENQATADERREHLRQTPAAVKFVSYEPALGSVDWTGWEFVDQIISGGESGPQARPSHPIWHRATRDFCQENNIAYFMKQWGKWLGVDYTGKVFGEIPQWVRSDGLTGDINKRPEIDFGDGHGAVRVGKKRAGHLLDGKEWREFPQGRILPESFTPSRSK